MNSPRLSIGIPTLNRPDHLQNAIDSCLAQTVPVHIIVADQGHTEETQNVMARYAEHPNVEYIPTTATCLWENWEAAALGCDTEFFAWLQDDDVVSRIYASRVIKAFDKSPRSLHWQANCHCSPDRIHALKWGWNGPQVGVRMMEAGAEEWPGQMILASMYIMSWALSPGVAFRCGEVFSETLRNLPRDCDLFQERLVLASMGLCAPFIADSVTAGYWHHHGKNESYTQNAKKDETKRQQQVMVEYLDKLLDQAEDWKELFYMWLRTRSPAEIMPWITKFECKSSRYYDEMIGIMHASIIDRVEKTEAPELELEDSELDVVYL